MSAARPDRRLGHRYDTSATELTWHVPQRHWLRTRMEPRPVTMVNVSTTGAAVVADTVPDFECHSLVTLECEGLTITAAVQRIVPGDHDGVSYYGLQFVDPPPAAIELFMSRTDAATRAALEEYWRTAG